MVVQRQSHELYWVAPLRGSIPQSQLFDFVAQLVEQYTFNVWVQGSNPCGVTGRLISKIGIT